MDTPWYACFYDEPIAHFEVNEDKNEGAAE
ncbi:MAG: hypothetical protein QOD99_972 [Chthoniobacter sp.]|jgi:hypothetical protein|nr:hypothetical protein [Chthoniobacter sp.]